jgi:hypothetical protein
VRILKINKENQKYICKVFYTQMLLRTGNSFLRTFRAINKSPLYLPVAPRLQRSFGWFSSDVKKETETSPIAEIPTTTLENRQTAEIQASHANPQIPELTTPENSEPITPIVENPDTLSLADWQENLALLKTEKTEFQNLIINNDDLGNMAPSMEPDLLSDEIGTLWSNLFSISPNHIYEFLDESSRELTLAIAEYNSLGMGVAILSVSLLVKIFLTPFNVNYF